MCGARLRPAGCPERPVAMATHEIADLIPYLTATDIDTLRAHITLPLFV